MDARVHNLQIYQIHSLGSSTRHIAIVWYSRRLIAGAYRQVYAGPLDGSAYTSLALVTTQPPRSPRRARPFSRRTGGRRTVPRRVSMCVASGPRHWPPSRARHRDVPRRPARPTVDQSALARIRRPLRSFICFRNRNNIINNRRTPAAPPPYTPLWPSRRTPERL